MESGRSQMPNNRVTTSVKDKVERFAIYEADIKNEDTEKGKRIFYVLGTRLVIEREDSGNGQTLRRKGPVPTLAWKTKRNLHDRSVSKKQARQEVELKTSTVTVLREHPGTFRKNKTRDLPVILTTSLHGESSDYQNSDSVDEVLSVSPDQLVSEESTPRMARKPKAHQERVLEEASKHYKRKKASSSEDLSSTSEIDAADTGIGDCPSEELEQSHVQKKHVLVEWTVDQKKILYSSFARKSHDYSVYISSDEAMKRAKELNVYDPDDSSRVFVSCPVFKVVAGPTQMMGKDGFVIKAIKKIYFQDRAGHVQAGMMDVIYHDKSNVEPNDFVFDATQIRDNIVPPVKISQDLKVPMIIGGITTLLQILQVVTSYYLTTGITKDSSA